MVDVYVVSGFLGSGKTTLLVRLLHEAKQRGKQPAVLMNEFGEMNIDGQTIQTAEGDVPMREMLNGCICCTGSEQSEAEIQTLLVNYPEVDVLFIETTGAAHPVEALDAIFSPLFANRLVLKGIITVMDLQRWSERERLSPQMRALFLEQLRHAHFIVANKMDTLSDDAVAREMIGVTQWLRDVPVVQTSDANVKFADIVQQLQRPIRRDDFGETTSVHHHLQSKAIRLTGLVHRERFERWVSSLPDRVYRLKGYVQLGERKTYSVQYAYGMMQWLPEWVQMEPILVLIGDDIQSIEPPSTIYL